MITARKTGRLRGSAATLALAMAGAWPSSGAIAQATPPEAASSPPISDPAAAPAPATAGGTDAAAPPGASEGPADGTDIVVTARRRKESAQDVPIALTVVGNEALERSGNFSINQVQQLVPALQVSAFNPRNSVITIRGLGANSSSASDGLEYGVGFYLDGVYYARPGQSQFDLMDLQQIEVLRGPQGTLFGKNTTAGALNITTRLPSFTPEFSGEAWAGNYGFLQFRASGSAPISDKVAVRLTAAYTDRDGFVTNRFDGGDAQSYKNTTIRAQVYAKPIDDVTIRLIGDYSRQKQRFQIPVVAGYFSTYANGATIPNNIFDRAARFNYQLLSPDAFNREANANSPFQANMRSYGFSAEVDANLGFANLTSISAYRAWDWDPKNDLDATTLSIQLKGQLQNRQRQMSQEIRLASDGTHTIDYVVGAYYFWQTVKGYGKSEYGSDFARWNFNPRTVPAATIAAYNTAFDGFEADSYSNPTTNSYAAFGQTDWHITPRLTLTTGVRFTHEDKHGVFQQYWVAGADPATLSAAQIAARSNFSPRRNFQADDHANAVTGLATLAYKVAPDALVYATYSRGNKSGGLNLTQGGTIQPVVAPEKVNNYEIGFKSQFLDRKVTLNAAAFWTDVQDYQTTVTVPIVGTTGFVSYIANIPKTRSRGGELDLSYSPSRWLSLTASGAYTDARYIRYANAPQAPDAINEGQFQDLSGKRLSNVPKFAYTLGADVTRPLGFEALGDTIDVYGHADWSHRSSFNSQPSNSVLSVIHGYGLLTLRAGLRTDNGRYDLSFFMKNALNKDYYVQLSPGTFGLTTSVLGDPRTFGGTLRVRF